MNQAFAKLLGYGRVSGESQCSTEPRSRQQGEYTGDSRTRCETIFQPPPGPPPGPPPILTFSQTRHLAAQGWLPIELDQSFQDHVQDLLGSGREFFSEPEPSKKSLYPPRHGTEFGYYTVPSSKEYVTFRHAVHASSALEASVSRVWAHSAALLHRILCDLASAGYYSRSAWNSLVDDALTFPSHESSLEDSTTLLRLFNYLPHGGVADEHVDLGLLTLCIPDGRGLELKNASTDDYVAASGPIVLVGSFASRLMRNRVRPGRHRVVGNPKGRQSIVFAFRPCLKGHMNLSLLGGEGIVETRACWERLRRTMDNVNATKEVREEDKAKRARREAKQSRAGKGK